MSMKKSCGVWLAIYVIVAVFVGHLIYRRLPILSAAFWGGAIGGGIVWMGLANLAGVRTKLAEIVRLRATEAGGPPPDGETMAVVGTVEAEAQALTSPLSGVQCVAYKYEVRRGESLLFEGFALAPCSIFTQHGKIRILAQPDLQLTPREVLRGDAVPQFTEYIKHAKFHEPSLGDFRTMFAEMHAETDHIRRDNRMTGDDGAIKHASFKEWTLVPGQRVFATGCYSAQRNGLVPDPGAPLSLIVRDATDGSLVGRSVRGAVGSFIGAVIFLAIAAAGLVGFYALVPLAVAEQKSPERRTMWREVRFDHLLELRVRPKLRQMGLLDSGTIVADLPEGTARGRVTANGRDVVVSRATAAKLGDLYTIHIDDDVMVLTIDEYGHPIRLRFGNEDVDPRQNFEMNMTGHVSGRVMYLRDDAETPAARVTFHATQGGQ
jgi:hypothetical protein